jgi:membrane-bound ClpP family serine protease
MTLVYAAALFVLCYALVAIEFFIPTGGVIGLGAAATAIAAVVIAFTHSFHAGVTMIGLFLVTTPVAMTSLVRVWPRTAMGQRMLNRRPGQVDPGAAPRITTRGTPLQELVGQLGVAKSDLLPAGLVLVAGEKLDAVSEGVAIDNGTPIIVTRIQGRRVRVRPASERELQAAEGAQHPQSPAALETLNLEELE